MQTNKQLGNLYFELDAFIQAAEGEQWPSSITRHSKTFDQLIKLERRMQREVAAYLADFAANRVANLVDWREYRNRQYSQAAELVVEVNAAAFEAEQKILLNILFDYIVEGGTIGGAASTALYNVPVSELNLAAAIQKAARRYSNQLVGGIGESTRNALRRSLEASIDLGEDIEAATKRIADRIGDPQRAVTIARTESVNSYGQGVNTFGETTGAKGKVIDAVLDDRTSPICKELNSKYGNPKNAIGIKDAYSWHAMGGGSKAAPGFHVNCRTGHYLLY